MVLPSFYPYMFAAFKDCNMVWEAETDKNLFDFLNILSIFQYFIYF